MPPGQNPVRPSSSAEFITQQQKKFFFAENRGIIKAFNGRQKKEITENQFNIFEVWNGDKENVLSTILRKVRYDNFFLIQAKTFSQFMV